MSGKFDADVVKSSANIVSVIGSYVDIKQDGREFKGLCPFHSEDTPSFHVVPEKGFYHCFGCGEHGDVIDFLTSHTGASFREACEALGGEVLLDSRPMKKLPTKERVDPYKGYEVIPTKERLSPGKKVDLINPKRDGKIWKDAVPVSTHPYYNADGTLHGYVIRLEIDGQKLNPQVRYTSQGWTFHPFDEPRPLYNLKSILAYPLRQVIIVEGEKAVDSICKFVSDKVNVVSWSGGTNGLSKADWSPVSGKKVVVIPDRDDPGLKAMREIVEIINPSSVKYVAPSKKLPKGWDVADQEWNCDTEIYAWCKENTVLELPESYNDKSKQKQRPEPEVKPEPETAIEKVEVEVLPPPSDQIFIELQGKHSIDSNLIAAAVRNSIIYDGYLRQWFKYSFIWNEVPKELVVNFITDIMDRACPEGYQNSRFTNTYSMLQGRLAVVREEHNGFKLDNWMTEKHLLPMKNGILNLTSKELIPHSPKHLMNWNLPHEWPEEGTEYPVIARFLDSVSNGDKNTKAVLLCFLAAVLRGMSRSQKFLEIIGTPGTGKSTFIKLACELVGESNLTTTSMDMLQNNNFETANLYGKRLTIITDADKYGGSVEVFKAATGQDPLRFERKNQQAGKSFIYQGMIIVAANQPVQYRDQSTAMMRRRVPVHIDHRLEEKDRDPDLSEKMRRELPGLLRDLVMLDEKYIEEVLNDSLGKREPSRYRSLVETNPVADWLNENCLVCEDMESRIGNCVRDGMTILNSDEWLYPNHIAFMESTCRKAKPALNTFKKTVMELLQTVGIKCSASRNRHGAFIKGIRLREEYDVGEPTMITGEATK
jgi:P4 family phage/plasmid primase-like protien